MRKITKPLNFFSLMQTLRIGPTIRIDRESWYRIDRESRYNSVEGNRLNPVLAVKRSLFVEIRF